MCIVHTTSTYTCLARAPGGGKVGWGGGEKGGKGQGNRVGEAGESTGGRRRLRTRKRKMRTT